MTCKESHRTSKESRKYGSDRQFKENHKTTKKHRKKWEASWENKRKYKADKFDGQQKRQRQGTTKIWLKKINENPRHAKEMYVTQG